MLRSCIYLRLHTSEINTEAVAPGVLVSRVMNNPETSAELLSFFGNLVTNI